MNKQDRINELQEKMQEFILNESVTADDNPSWGEIAESQAEAERRWNETDDGKELKKLTPVRVIFRMYKHQGNDVCIAFFPALPGDMNPYRTCQSYEHIGQHGAATIDFYLKDTRPATPEEYKDLLDELTSIGYDNVKVCKKMTYQDFLNRKALTC